MKQPPDVHSIITYEIAPEVLTRFSSKGSDYGDSWRLLGAKGQFSDINRKFWKLYNSIWLDRDLVGEQPDECVEDIIGHCFLLLYILRREPTPEGAIFSSPEKSLGAHGAPSDTLSLPEDERRCSATENAGENVVRCELFEGHESPHLANYGRINQYQWKE